MQPFLALAASTKPPMLEDFIRAYSLVSSRAFYVDNYHGLCMVPLADAFNHHFEPCVCLQADDVVCDVCGSYQECPHDLETSSVPLHTRPGRGTCEEAVEMVATGCVEAEDEIFNTYGSLSNARLLAEYGFSLEANEDDRVCWFTVEQLAVDCGQPIDDVARALEFANFLEDDKRILPIRKIAAQPLHERFFIDADGRMSDCLIELAQKFSDRADVSDSEAAGGCSNSMAIRICKSRISRLHNSDEPLEALFAILDVSVARSACPR